MALDPNVKQIFDAIHTILTDYVGRVGGQEDDHALALRNALNQLSAAIDAANAAPVDPSRAGASVFKVGN